MPLKAFFILVFSVPTWELKGIPWKEKTTVELILSRASSKINVFIKLSSRKKPKSGIDMVWDTVLGVQCFSFLIQTISMKRKDERHHSKALWPYPPHLSPWSLFINKNFHREAQTHLKVYLVLKKTYTVFL